MTQLEQTLNSLGILAHCRVASHNSGVDLEHWVVTTLLSASDELNDCPQETITTDDALTFFRMIAARVPLDVSPPTSETWRNRGRPQRKGA